MLKLMILSKISQIQADKILSNADVDQLTKPQDKKDEQTMENNADAGNKLNKETDSETEDAAKTKSAKSSILNVFKRKKKEPEKPQEDTEASAPSGDETPPEEKT